MLLHPMVPFRNTFRHHIADCRSRAVLCLMCCCHSAAYRGQEGSTIVLQDVVRVKLACQLPQGTIRAAASFKRVSPAFPENNVTLWEHFCLDAAINGPQVTNQCYEDVMHFEAFSNIATSDDPSLGRQVG